PLRFRMVQAFKEKRGSADKSIRSPAGDLAIRQHEVDFRNGRVVALEMYQPATVEKCFAPARPLGDLQRAAAAGGLDLSPKGDSIDQFHFLVWRQLNDDQPALGAQADFSPAIFSAANREAVLQSRDGFNNAEEIPDRQGRRNLRRVRP